MCSRSASATASSRAPSSTTPTGSATASPIRCTSARRAILLDGAPTPERLLATLREQRPSVYFSVPALYRQLVADRDADGALESVRLCISAAEPLPLRDLRAVARALRAGDRRRDRLDGDVHRVLLERARRSRSGSDRTAGARAMSCGSPTRRVSVIEGEGEGTLEVRGGSRAACYWQQPEQTARNMPGEWLITGDRFRRRQDGTYTYVGRADDMFKVGGLWVSPLDIEKVLLEHPAVAAAGVVGVTDRRPQPDRRVRQLPRRRERRRRARRLAALVVQRAHARLRIPPPDPLRRRAAADAQRQAAALQAARDDRARAGGGADRARAAAGAGLARADARRAARGRSASARRSSWC